MKRIVLALSILFAASSSGRADLIVDYNLQGHPGNDVSVSPTASGPGITGLNLTRGAGLNAANAGNSFSSNGWNSPGSTDYMSFGFTVASGSKVSLTDLVIGTQSSATGPRDLGLFYSGDGFTSSLGTFTQPSAAPLNSTFDLSALANLTGTVEFRILALDNIAPNGGAIGTAGTFRVTNFFNPTDSGSFGFDGTISSDTSSVPEPTSLLFSGMAFAGAAVMRRRQKAPAAAARA